MTKEDLFNQGMDLLAEGKLEEALEAYKKALNIDPNYEDALHALAMDYANLDRLDEASEVGKKLIQVSPEDELAHTSLSIFYQRKGMIAEAEEVGAKARTLGWKRELQEKKKGEESPVRYGLRSNETYVGPHDIDTSFGKAPSPAYSLLP